MNKFYAALLLIGAVMIFAGCESTRITDPGSEETGFRSLYGISAEEMRQVAVKAVEKLMTNRKFIQFILAHQRKNNNALPVLKLAACKNETDDPDLKVELMTEYVNTALLDSGKVEVSLHEGAGAERTRAVRKSRYLEDDDMVDQKTVVKYNGLKAASIILYPSVISNRIRDGRHTSSTRMFVMDVINIETGLALTKVVVPLSFVKTRGIVGW